eukprot:TRINITY_DN4936_c0_g1_i1.p1 TRINITY_DN4936_c0_g1~~TRINITY_DN4936_c0_g1_i1.p1  ORF type:complete len:383 (+),score=42.29 TRINITY_DN4936_c0_g1_i1:94-1242(+)
MFNSTVSTSARQAVDTKDILKDVWDDEETRCDSLSSLADEQFFLANEDDSVHASFVRLPLWDSRRFESKCRIAAGTSGSELELCTDLLSQQVVCVKRIKPSEEAFAETDVAVAQLFLAGALELENDECGAYHVEAISKVTKHMCTCLGAFRDSTSDAVYLVSEYLPGGDLFDVALDLGNIGPDREERAWPYIHSLVNATLAFHEAGIAHGDMSVENVLLRRGSTDVVLIDFETISFENAMVSGTRGKPAYQAPEMHDGQFYSARDAELFALGVAVYVMATGSYPWVSTRPNQCKYFGYFCHRGLEGLLMKRTVKENNVVIGRAWNLLSYELRMLLTCLLSPNPSERAAGLNPYRQNGGIVCEEAHPTLKSLSSRTSPQQGSP